MENNLFFIGDTHGSMERIYSFIRKHSRPGDVFIHVGDFGVGFRDKGVEWLLGINKFLNEKGVELIVVRGNHDNPAYFSGYCIQPNLKLVSDYTVIERLGKKILLVGGAISVDRFTRLEGISYWRGEKFLFNEEALNHQDVSNIDIVVTHTSPDFCHPVGANGLEQFSVNDSTLIEELLEERALVTKMNDLLKANNPNITNWFFGHFHQSHVEFFNNTAYRCLDIGGIFELRN